MEPIDYAGALRRSWRLILLLALVGAVVAVLVPVAHAKRVKSAFPYAASVIVGSPPNGTGSPLRAGVTSQQILFFATQASTQQTVESDAGVTPSAMTAALIPASGVTTAGASAILKRNAPTDVELIGMADTPSGAAAIANTFAVDLGQVVEAGLQASPKNGAASAGTGYTINGTAAVAPAAKGHKSSLTASRKVRGLAGLVVGAVIAAAIVLLRELLDKRLRTSTRTEANFGFPVIVEIPTAALGMAPVAGVVPVVDVIRDPDSPAAEAYRMLRMSVIFERLASLSGPTDPFALGGLDPGMAGLLPEATGSANDPTSEIGERRVVMVVSAGSEPTRPHVAANLAAIYAEAGERVVVISTGDLEATVGGPLAEGEIRPEDVRARLEPSRLEYVSRLALSPFVANSGQLVNRAPAVLEAARSLCDVVIVEVPPLLAVHHAEALARSVDVVLVVAECKFTTFADARQAGDLLRRIGAPVLGVVFTNVQLRRSDIRQSALMRPLPTQVPPRDRTTQKVQAIDAGVGAGADTQSRV